MSERCVSLYDWRFCLTEFTDHVTKIKARWNSPLTSFPVINFWIGLLGCCALIYHSWEINLQKPMIFPQLFKPPLTSALPISFYWTFGLNLKHTAQVQIYIQKDTQISL